MSSSFAPILAALRALKSAGPDGFEGVVRDALEVLCGHSLYIVKSGPQKGKDIIGDECRSAPRIAIESKRFREATNLALDEMKEKLREACETKNIDTWGIALSKEMVEPDWSEICAIAEAHGVTPIALDWREAKGALPKLAVLVAQAFDVVGERLGSLQPELIAEVTAHPQYETIIKELRDKLVDPSAGFELARRAASEWLSASLRSETLAKQRLRGLVHVAADSTHFVPRKTTVEALDAWWKAESGSAVVLGDEGRGKSWVVMHWANRIAEEGDALVVVVSAKDVETGDPADVIAKALKRALDADQRQLAVRIRRWSGGPQTKALFVIDGINEHWTVDWQELFNSFNTEPWNTSVRLLVTTRTQFWRNHFRPEIGEAAPIEIAVSEYTDDELDALLITESSELRRSEMSHALISLMRVPRIASLAIRVSESVKDRADLSVADLILSDWKSRVERNHGITVDEEGLSDFIRDIAKRAQQNREFQISTREIHERLSVDSGRDLDHYQSAISELVEGSWLIGAGRKDRYKLNERMLPYAIGLEVAVRLGAAESAEEAKEIIAPYLEPLRGADEGAAIVRAACSLVVALGDARASVKEAVIEAWLAEQNFGLEDFLQFWPLVSREPEAFLNVAERSFEAPLGSSSVSEILIKSLANASKWPDVKKLLVDRLPGWAGSYKSDPIARRLDRGELEWAERTAKLASDWNDAEPETLLLSRHLRKDATDYLADAAISIISYVPRAPFVETIATYALTAVLNQGARVIDSFEWILRRNEEDAEAASDAVLAVVRTLLSTGTEVATSVAKTLVQALATSAAYDQIPDAVHRSYWPIGGWFELNEDSVVTRVGEARKQRDGADPVLEAADFAPFALDPKTTLTGGDLAIVTEAARAAREDESAFLELVRQHPDVAKVFARWTPTELRKIAAVHWRALTAMELDGRIGGSPISLEDFYLLLDASFSKELYECARSHATKRTDEKDARQARIHRHNVGAMAAALAPPEEQVRLLEEFDVFPGFVEHMADFLEAPSDEVVARIIATAEPESVSAWLHYLSLVTHRDNRIDDDRLLALAVHDGPRVREKALHLILANGTDRLRSAFAESGWKYVPEMGRQEAIYGSYILMKHEPTRPIEELAARIVPELLPFAVEERGLQTEDVAFLHRQISERLEKEIAGVHTSRQIVRVGLLPAEVMDAVVRHGPELLSKLEEALAANHALGFMREYPVPELIQAGISINPDQAARLWRHATEANERMSFNDVGLISLAYAPTDAPEFAQLRVEALTLAKKDEEIALAVRHCQSNGHEAWLIGFAVDQLFSASAGRIALGLSIAGFLDESPAAEEAWETLTTAPLEGWLDDVRKWARRRYEMNKFARHWLYKYLTAPTEAEAFDAIILFNASFDLRCQMWSRPVIAQAGVEPESPRLRYLSATNGRRSNERKKRDSPLADTLYGTKRSRSVDPWF